jgi:type VI secretion system secreted protein Hcp
MRSRHIDAALLLTAAVLFAAPATAAFDSYLKIDGVPGESKDAAHMGWIAVDSYQFETIRSAGNPSSSARTGKLTLRDLTITKHQDKSSPKLLEAAASGKHFPNVELHVSKRTPDRSGQAYLVVTMRDVLISSARPSGGGGELPTESITFNFGAIEWKYTPQKPDGTAAQRLAVAPGAAASAAVALAPTAAPPKITGASAAAPFAGLAATLTIASTGPCQDAFVDWGDGSIAEGHTLTGKSTVLPAHTYATAGAKTIKVGGRDAPYWPQAHRKRRRRRARTRAPASRRRCTSRCAPWRWSRRRR